MFKKLFPRFFKKTAEDLVAQDILSGMKTRSIAPFDLQGIILSELHEPPDCISANGRFTKDQLADADLYLSRHDYFRVGDYGKRAFVWIKREKLNI